MLERFVQVFIVCALWLAVGAPALADGLTGTYVAKGPTGAVLIQIVETGGGKLTGRYQHVVLLPTGELDRMNASITGASDGQTIVITIVPVDLSGNIVASGSFDGSVLHLTGGRTGPAADLNLARSNEADFQMQADGFADQAKRVSDAAVQVREKQRLATAHAEEAKRIVAAQADRLAAIEDLIKRMAFFTERADRHLPEIASIEQRYRSGTAWMRSALSREQSIFGDGEAAVARSQIAVAINQAAVDATQLHIEVQSNHRDFQAASGPLLDLLSRTQRTCQSRQTGSAAAGDGTKSEAEDSACLRLVDSAREFQDKVKILQGAYARIEDLWLGVLADQESIIHASENFSE